MKLSLFIWLLISLFLCLIPASWTAVLSVWLFHASDGWECAGSGYSLKEPLAHAVLMGGVAFSITRMVMNKQVDHCLSKAQNPTTKDYELSTKNDAPSTKNSAEQGAEAVAPPQVANSDLQTGLVVVAIIFVLAFVIEELQALLPASFSRGFGWDDIWFSVGGGFLGSIIATLWRGNAAVEYRRLNKEC